MSRSLVNFFVRVLAPIFRLPSHYPLPTPVYSVGGKFSDSGGECSTLPREDMLQSSGMRYARMPLLSSRSWAHPPVALPLQINAGTSGAFYRTMSCWSMSGSSRLFSGGNFNHVGCKRRYSVTTAFALTTLRYLLITRADSLSQSLVYPPSTSIPAAGF